MDKLINPLDVLYESRCLTCMHRISRLVEPVTQEDIEYYLDVLDLEPGTPLDLFIEQHKCLLTDEDIDGVIRECNQYDLASKFNLIRDYRF